MAELSQSDVWMLGRLINNLQSFREKLEEITSKNRLNNPKSRKELVSLKVKILDELDDLMVTLDKI